MGVRARTRRSGPRAEQARGRPSGIGRKGSLEAETVSDDLRRHTGGYLPHRRRVAGLSLAASTAMGAVAAYQNGLVRRLPEPPVAVFEAERVDASGEAYQFLKAPDASLGLASYAVTLALAGAGTADRWRARPWLPLALLAKVITDAAAGAYLTAEQISKHRRLCSWCLTATAASLAMVPAAIPEAAAATRGLLRGRSRRATEAGRSV